MKGFSKTQTPNLWRNNASQQFYAVGWTPGKTYPVLKSLKTDEESVAKLRLEDALAKILTPNLWRNDERFCELAAVRDVAAAAAAAAAATAAYLKMTTNEIDRLRVAIDRLEKSARSTSHKGDAGNSAKAPRKKHPVKI